MGRFNPILPRAILSALLVVLAVACCAAPQGLSVEARGTGTLVAWLSGLDFEASIEGEISLAGEAVLDGEVVPFSAEGALRGFGVRGIVTLVSEGWIGYSAVGRTDAGDAIDVRGLLHVRRVSLVPLQAGELFVGEHTAVFFFRGASFPFCGEFSAAVEGGLEPAKTPGTIQLAGSGTARFDGDLGGGQSPVPMVHPALPPEFLEYVSDLGFGT